MWPVTESWHATSEHRRLPEVPKLGEVSLLCFGKLNTNNTVQHGLLEEVRPLTAQLRCRNIEEFDSREGRPPAVCPCAWSFPSFSLSLYTRETDTNRSRSQSCEENDRRLWRRPLTGCPGGTEHPGSSSQRCNCGSLLELLSTGKKHDFIHSV